MSTRAQAQQLGSLPDSPPVLTQTKRQPYYEARRVAYDNGYREGLKEGERDGRRHDSLPLPGQSDLAARRQGLQPHRSATSSAIGSSSARATPKATRQATRATDSQAHGMATVARVPRQDYLRVSEGSVYPGSVYPDSNRYPRSVPRNQVPYGYGAAMATSPAYPNGLNDGIEKGREDARKHRSYDPLPPRRGTATAITTTRANTGRSSSTRTSTARAFKEGYDRGYRRAGY